eukprot:1159255-Pelagomonas_calceolata.AAC.2
MAALPLLPDIAHCVCALCAAYWSNACVAAKISVSAQPPSMQVATGPTGAEFNHPNIVQDGACLQT